MKKRSDEKKPCDVSEVFESLGKYHAVQYFLACLPSMFVTMININFVFVAGDLDFRCRIPQCETAESTSDFPSWWPNKTIDRCTKPILRYSVNTSNFCTNKSFTAEVETCTEWIYDNNNTIVAELDLACQPWKVNAIGSIHNIGMLFSMMISGWMSDRFGRKPAMIICAVSSCIGHLKPFATSYYTYATVELIESIVSGGLYLPTSVLLIEIGGKNNRVLAGVLFSYVIYFGEMVFALIAILVPCWKTLIRIINTPSLLFISYIFIIRESPRWQMLNGKMEEAKQTIQLVAKMNKLEIDFEELKEMNDDQLKEKFSIDNYEVKEGFQEIFTSREILKRLAVASFCRFTCGFVYYGLVINSVWLPGNKYTNFLLSTVMSFPGELIALYFMNKIGRKVPLIVGYMICGITVVASPYVEPVWAKITLYLIGKMVISACFTGIITYTMELYPTSTRGSLLSMGSITSRIGAMLAPLTPMLVTISPALPCVLFALSSVLSSILLTITPETKDLPLMDTIGQVNAHAVVVNNAKRKNCETVVTKM